MLGSWIGTILAFRLGEGVGGLAPNASGSDVGIGLVIGTPIEESDAIGLIRGGIGCDDLIWLWLNRSLSEAVVPPPIASRASLKVTPEPATLLPSPLPPLIVAVMTVSVVCRCMSAGLDLEGPG